MSILHHLDMMKCDIIKASDGNINTESMDFFLHSFYHDDVNQWMRDIGSTADNDANTAFCFRYFILRQYYRLVIKNQPAER